VRRAGTHNVLRRLSPRATALGVVPLWRAPRGRDTNAGFPGALFTRPLRNGCGRASIFYAHSSRHHFDSRLRHDGAFRLSEFL
jgi:hypothetical protein